MRSGISPSAPGCRQVVPASRAPGRGHWRWHDGHRRRSAKPPARRGRRDHRLSARARADGGEPLRAGTGPGGRRPREILGAASADPGGWACHGRRVRIHARRPGWTARRQGRILHPAGRRRIQGSRAGTLGRWRERRKPALRMEKGRIAVDAERRTSIENVWAGGDCATGGKDLTVVAVQDGKLAAQSIDRYLKSGRAQP